MNIVELRLMVALKIGAVRLVLLMQYVCEDRNIMFASYNDAILFASISFLFINS